MACDWNSTAAFTLYEEKWLLLPDGTRRLLHGNVLKVLCMVGSHMADCFSASFLHILCAACSADYVELFWNSCFLCLLKIVLLLAKAFVYRVRVSWKTSHWSLAHWNTIISKVKWFKYSSISQRWLWKLIFVCNKLFAFYK